MTTALTGLLAAVGALRMWVTKRRCVVAMTCGAARASLPLPTARPARRVAADGAAFGEARNPDRVAHNPCLAQALFTRRGGDQGLSLFAGLARSIRTSTECNGLVRGIRASTELWRHAQVQ